MNFDQPHPEREFNQAHLLAENVVDMVFDNLTEKERGNNPVDDSAALRAFALDTKPGVLLGNVATPLSNPEPIKQYLARKGFDVIISGNLLINRRALEQRIESEKKFAEELGWKEGMTIEDFVVLANPTKGGMGRAITGFILGYPETAIRFYNFNNPPRVANDIAGGVDIVAPNGGRVYYFTTHKTLEHAPDVEALRARVANAFAKAGYKSTEPQP